VDLGRQNLDRTRDLFNQGLVARQNLDQAQNQYDTAQAQLRSAQARLQQVQAGNRLEDIAIQQAQVREAESAVAQARATRLGEATLGADVAAAAASVRTSQANVAQARDRLAETRIAAAIDGIVSKLSVQVGQSVIGGTTGGTLVLTLADTRVIQANVDVDESDIAQIRVGMPVRVTVDALPDRTFNGKVVRIAPQATVTQNVTQFDAIVDIEDPDRLLRLGMSADAEFIISERRNVLLVPAEAVRGQEAKVVLVVEGERLVPVAVETGVTDGRQTEITKGLQQGQTVYLGSGSPSNSAQPEQQVNPFLPQFPRGQQRGTQQRGTQQTRPSTPAR
jgi:HlyD family secretion protein